MIVSRFEAKSGRRFSRDGVSILLQAVARFKPNAAVTSQDLFNLFRHTNKYFENVGANEVERQGVSDLLTADNFPDLDNSEFYKFMSDDTLDHYKARRFEFGSIIYYRSIEKQDSKDSREGLCNVAIHTPKHLFTVSLTSGYNFGIFCGTSSLDHRAEMVSRFGPRIIRIANLKAFAAEAMRCLGATNYYFNRVVYNDLKMFRIRTLGRIRDNFPGEMDDRIFELLYEDTFLASFFMKPMRFCIERELRLVFEMPKDIPEVLRIENADLAKHVEILE